MATVRTTVFDDILGKGIREGQTPNLTKKAREWYRNMATNSGKTYRVGEDRTRNRKSIELGSMFMFKYDPKTKDKLPYYDTFPLIFPVEPAKDGFFGINLHYLHPKLRARLMDALYKYSTDKDYDTQTKLRITYQILKGASNVSMFKPCFKRYLTAHVRSDFQFVFPQEWDIALMLPLQSFVKSSAQKVWSDSYTQYMNGYSKK